MSGSSTDILHGVYPDYQSRQDFQIVKCVVVGDSGVGKTRLICARACGTRYSLAQLMQTRVPTVWAIDHYRKDKEVLDQSWVTVDGMNVSLRLWDTFGYHDKDRRFAYGRADVILACFSVVRPRSLRNIVHHWYPEIRRLCPGVPIILCGCQVDLRYLYLSEEFTNMDKGPFFREILEGDIVTSAEGRQVAESIDAYYYESSVLVPYGIDTVFSNVIRAALINKRDKHFWNMLGGLKRIGKPTCQQPHLPPRAPPPELHIPAPHHADDLGSLLQNQAYCDVIFVAQGVCIQAHKAVLAAASPVFEDLFLLDMSTPDPAAENQSNSTVQSRDLSTRLHRVGSQKESSVPPQKLDTVKLLENEEIETSSVDTADGTNADIIPSSSAANKSSLPCRVLNHPAFRSIELQHCEDINTVGQKVLQTVVTLDNSITPAAFQIVLLFLYTGRCVENYDALPDVRPAAELLGLKDLVLIATSLMNGEGFLVHEVEDRFQSQKCQRTKELLVHKGLLSDILFQVDDGSLSAHKSLLIASCDVMAGMFSYNFRESSAKVIQFPGVTKETFIALQEFLYTGTCPALAEVDLLELIELANRMCLPSLLAMVEQYIVEQLTLDMESGGDISENTLALIEPAQLHNATQLATWCLWYICSTYKSVYKRYSKVMQTMKPENQIFLAKHRWPPLWYLKEADYYEKCLVDLEREKPMKSYIRRGSDDFDSGCLGFCSRRNRRMKCVPSQATAVET